MFRLWRLITPSLLVLLVFSITVSAQPETATITGIVNDSNGASIPNATVKVKNVATNISLTAQSDDHGSYTVIDLRPGAYSVTVEKQDFKRVIRDGITLQVSQVARLDVTLDPG